MATNAAASAAMQVVPDVGSGIQVLKPIYDIVDDPPVGFLRSPVIAWCIGQNGFAVPVSLVEVDDDYALLLPNGEVRDHLGQGYQDEKTYLARFAERVADKTAARLPKG